MFQNLKKMDVRVLVLISFLLMGCLLELQIFVREKYDHESQIKLTALLEKETELQLKINDTQAKFNMQVSALEDVMFGHGSADFIRSELAEYYLRESSVKTQLDQVSELLSDYAWFESILQKIKVFHRDLSARFHELIDIFTKSGNAEISYTSAKKELGMGAQEFDALISTLTSLVTGMRQQELDAFHAARARRHFFNWLFIIGIGVPFFLFLYILLDRKVKALRETEKNFVGLSANMRDGVLVNYKGKHVFVNQSMANMLGYENESELIGTTIEDVVYPTEREFVLHNYQMRKQGKDVPSRYETLFVTREGKPIPAEVNASMTVWKGNPAGMVTIRDITERRKAERSLLESEARYQRAEKGTSDGLWEWNIITGEDYFSPRWLEMLGYKPGELLYHVDTFLDLIHPDDKPVVQRAVDDHLQNDTPFRVDMRLRRKTGDYLWVNSRGQAELNDQGSPALMTGVITDISRRMEAEEKLQESELWMKNIFNTLEEAVLVVSPGRELININKAAMKMFGYSRQEIEKLSTALFHVDEQHYIEFGRRINNSFNEGKVAHFEFEAKRKNGEIFPTEHIVSLLKSPDGSTVGIVSVVVDITERKKSEELVQRLAAIVTHSADFIGVADIDGRTEFLNTAGRKLVGIDSDDDFYQHWVHDYFSGQDRGYVENNILPQVVKTGRWAGEFNFRHFKSGELIPVWFDAFRIDDPVTGKPVKLATITRDIREKKQSEEELNRYREHLEELVGERTIELKNAQDELVRKQRLATLGQLTATVSHELRNPLGAMRPSLYFIRKKINTTDENLQQALELLDRNIQRCDRIIDELLDFTRISNIDLQTTRIDDWLDSVVNEQKYPEGMVIEKSYNLGELGMAIDSSRLRRAVINVLENACQAMTDENQKITNGGKARLAVQTRVNSELSDRMEITITDNGRGIPQDIQEKIFEPLFSTKTFGVGLGMSTVQQIMVQHNGGIDVRSKEGEGTSVTLWIPNRNSSEVVT